MMTIDCESASKAKVSVKGSVRHHAKIPNRQADEMRKLNIITFKIIIYYYY
jgi:hypothetical protein